MVEAPGQMFKATKVTPLAHFKYPFNAFSNSEPANIGADTDT